MTVNNTVVGGHMQRQLSFRCGNKFNVEVFRELNGYLNGRVVPIVCDEETVSPLKRIAEDYCRYTQLLLRHSLLIAAPLTSKALQGTSKL